MNTLNYGKGFKRKIAACLTLAMIFTCLAGVFSFNTYAMTKVYNFSDLTEDSYALKNGDVEIFGGALKLSTVGNENATAQDASYAALMPDGTSATISRAYRGKGLSISVSLSEGETVVVYYGGTDSKGSALKAVDMAVKDSSGTVLATESQAENKAAKVYAVSYTATATGVYSIVDTKVSNRTLLYAVAITDEESAVVDPSLPNPTATPSEPSSTDIPSDTPTATPKATVDPSIPSNVEIVSAKGWIETAYITWTNSAQVEKYNVYVKPIGGEYTKIDDELVRYYEDYYRADAVGLTAGEYKMKVDAIAGGEVISSAESEIMTVTAHIREGYAFDPKSPNYDPSGIGAYKNDGTLKDNAKVVYIDDTNKDSVKFDVVTDTSKGTVTSCTGLVEILTAREKNKSETTPLAIRMIGQVHSPNGMNSAGYVQIKASENITFEGIGDDATTYNWSFLLRETKNVEVRNLAVMEFYDDGISLDTNNYNDWVHNCDIFYGQDRGGDQKKGDGSLDVKSGSDYCTFSFNHFWDSGKSSLCGMKNDTYQGYHMTYHHNWFDHSDSRHPRVRGDIVHVYNNYYDGNSKYGVGATTGSNIFVENNVFRNCQHPILISLQGTDMVDGKGTFSGENGGMIKMYGNKITGGVTPVSHKDSATEFDAYFADTREEEVPSTYKTKGGNSVYNNFDIASDMYSYTPTKTDDVVSLVTLYAGRVEGGDFDYEFDNSVDDKSYDRNTVLGTMLQKYVTTLSKSYTSANDYPPTTGESTVPVGMKLKLSGVTLTDTAILGSIMNISEATVNATLICVGYNDVGALISTDSREVEISGTDGAVDFDFPASGAVSTYKIFLWDSINGMAPLSAAITK